MKNNKTCEPLFIQQLESAIYLLGQVKSSLPSPKSWNMAARQQARLLRIFLPYCIHPSSLEGLSLLLNRNYKPIGVAATEWVDYAEYPFAHFKQSAGTLDEDGRWYFFDDGTAPWESRHGLDRLIGEYESFMKILD